MHWIKQNDLCMFYINVTWLEIAMVSLRHYAMYCPVQERVMARDGRCYATQNPWYHEPKSVSIILLKHTRTIWPAAAGYHNDILDRPASNFTNMGLIPRKEAKNGLTHYEIICYISTDFLIGHQPRVLGITKYFSFQSSSKVVFNENILVVFHVGQCLIMEMNTFRKIAWTIFTLHYSIFQR